MSAPVFRRAEGTEVAEVFGLVLARIQWMEATGIRQWNVTRYDTAYPLPYYEAALARGELFVLVEGGAVQAGAVLLSEDDRWSGPLSAEPALYLHNFVARPGAKGAGRTFLRLAEDHARAQGKTRMRLDSAVDNAALADYYARAGYVPVGRCADGPYQGVLREKRLDVLDRAAVLARLGSLGVPYELTEHKAVYSMAELADVPIPYPEADAKNLFLRDNKKRHHYLLTLRGDKQADLRAFRQAQGTRPLSFAPAEDLMALLGLTPGAVTPLGLLNDPLHRVIWCIDRALVDGGLIGVHPCDNTATIWLKTADLIRVIENHGSTVRIVDL